MIFLGDLHQEAYNGLKAKTGVSNDREYCSALYVLAAVGKREILRYVTKDGIGFDGLLKAAATWSSGEKALVKLAATLFNAGAWPVSVNDVFYHLDGDSARVAIEALNIRYNR